MPKILDNIVQQTDTELLETLGSSYRLDAAIGYFNLRGWRLLAEAIDGLPERLGKPKARILVGIQEDPQTEMRRLASTTRTRRMDNKQAEATRKQVTDEYQAQLQVGTPNDDDEEALRALLHQMRAGHVDVRVFLAHRLHAKLYLCHRDDTAAPRVAYVGSSNLTKAGLQEQGELNVDVVDGDATAKLARWFEDRWNDRLTLPAVPELIDCIEQSWASETQLDPYLIYLKIAYHLSREAREGLIEYGLPASMRDILLDFQAAAVKIAARIVMQKGGAMIGDVVGLGKTLVGTAVARLLQEEQGFETLVVCPKNLVNMWEDYLHTYEVRGTVKSLSMVHKELPDFRRHRLVIVDEAHNLRSDKRRDHMVLRDYIANNDSRTLLLTATPYNKEYADLASQLGLFIRPDDDLGIRPELAIAEIGEAALEARCDGRTSSLKAFRRSIHLEDWQSLMSQYLVRRTRRFVEDNYTERDKRGRYLQFGSGKRFYFPKREAHPLDRNLTADDPAYQMASDETLDSIRDLMLPRYRLGDYLSDHYMPANKKERDLRDNLVQSTQGNLAGFTRITMFKRLSSSGPAFLNTLKRHRLRNLVTAFALEHDLPVPIGSVDNALWAKEVDGEPEDTGELAGFETLTETEAPAASAYKKLREKRPKAISWAPHLMFTPALQEDLHHDADVITQMLDRFGIWEADNDGKIAALEELVTDRFPDDKVLIFTEAADTARYVADELLRRGIEAVGVVTGDSEDPASLARRFSPRSNIALQRRKKDKELRILISTDVLSEGQNLQDAHIVVNYDLPWAIVKLVQRAGRVDRIGQTAPKVLVYSLLPAASVEQEIALRDRIRKRLGENALLLGSDESFFGDSTERRFVEGVYDEYSESHPSGVDEVDPVSMAYEIWRHAEKEHPDLAERARDLPNVVLSTKQISRASPKSGVLVHTYTDTATDAFAFVRPNGEARRLTPQEALRIAECAPDTKPVPRLGDHHELTATALGGPLRRPPGRATGALQGVRGKVWKRLHDHMDTFEDNLLFTRHDLEAAHDAINDRPLRESATHNLAAALRERTLDDLAALVVDLHKYHQLCVPVPADGRRSEPSIICTMGLRDAS